MTETRFTPGPWTAFSDGSGIMSERDGPVVSCRHPRQGGKFLTPEDASLIAAAPDLYEALQALLDARSTLPGETTDEFVERRSRAQARAVAALAKAVPNGTLQAKAEGETHG